MRRRPTLLALIAGAALLGGCNATTVNSVFIDPGYSRSLVQSSVTNGGLALQTAGAATQGLNAQASTQLVASRVTTPGWLGNVRLEPGVEPEQRHMLFIFNPAQIGTAANRGCTNLQGVPLAAPPADRVVVFAAFCGRRSTLTSANGSVGLADQGEQAVVELLQQMTLQLLPPQNPVHRRGRRAGGGP